MERRRLDKDCSKIKRMMYSFYEKKEYEKALKTIFFLAEYIYQTNIEYYDEEIEKLLMQIMYEMNIKGTISPQNPSPKSILFYDGFGQNTRGLALIYIKAFIQKGYQVQYLVSETRKDSIPYILQELNKQSLEVLFIPQGKYEVQIKWLQNKLDHCNVTSVFLYMMPSDICGNAVGAMFEKSAVRYLINLTDHAFWLGTSITDYVIEFRDYGAYISREARRISEQRIIKLPYYPVIDKNQKFLGFPFTKGNKKIIFSGGSLYKTYGGGNKYYIMLQKILERNKDIIFLYAGSGNGDQLKQLMKKFPNRVYWIEERTDLYQLMKNVDLYLSTYPMIGGLMTQYAAVAGIIPFTLLHDDCSTGTLLNSKEISCEFWEMDELIDALELYLKNPEYMKEERKKLGEQVITEDIFAQELENIIVNNRTNFRVDFKERDMEKFPKTYLERLNFFSYVGLFGRKHIFFIGKKFFFRYILGVMVNCYRKIIQKKI